MTALPSARPQRRRIMTPERQITKAIAKSDANQFAFLAATNPGYVYPSYVDFFVTVLTRKCEDKGASAPVRAFTLLALRLKQQQSPLIEGLTAATFARFAKAVLREKDPAFFLSLVQASIEGFNGIGLRREHLDKTVDQILSPPAPANRKNNIYQLITALRGLGPRAVRPDLLAFLETKLESQAIHTFLVSPFDEDSYLGGTGSLLLLVEKQGSMESLTRGGQPVPFLQIIEHIALQNKPVSGLLRDANALAVRSGSAAALVSAAEIRALAEAQRGAPLRNETGRYRASQGAALDSLS